MAPVAKFKEPSFTLAEGGMRSVRLDIVEGARGEGVPAAATRIANTGTATNPVENWRCRFCQSEQPLTGYAWGVP